GQLFLLLLQRGDLRLDFRLAGGQILLLRGLLGGQGVQPGLLVLQGGARGGQRRDVALLAAGQGAERVHPVDQFGRRAGRQQRVEATHPRALVGVGDERAHGRGGLVHLLGELGDARRQVGELRLGTAQLHVDGVVLLHYHSERTALLFDLLGQAGGGGVGMGGGWGQDRGDRDGDG